MLVLFLVLFETAHPFGPVFGLHAAGLCPAAFRIEVSMPRQRPQFLEPDLPDRPIEKNAVDHLAVSVETDSSHLIAAGEVFRCAVIHRRLILGKRPDIVPITIEKNRYLIRRLDIDVLIVVARVAARVSIAQPLVEAVTAEGAVIEDTPCGKRIEASLGQRFGGRRAQAHIQIVVLRPHHDGPSAIARLAFAAETLVKIAVSIRGEHRPDQRPLMQTRLADYRPRLLFHPLQGRHQYRQQQRDYGDYDQKLY